MTKTEEIESQNSTADTDTLNAQASGRPGPASGNKEVTRVLPASTAKKPTKSKTDQLVRLLSGKSPRDVTYLGTRLGWQPHTTRAAISRLRKAGVEVVSEKPDRAKATRYRIAKTGEAKRAHETTGSTDAG